MDWQTSSEIQDSGYNITRTKGDQLVHQDKFYNKRDTLPIGKPSLIE